MERELWKGYLYFIKFCVPHASQCNRSLHNDKMMQKVDLLLVLLAMHLVPAINHQYTRIWRYTRKRMDSCTMS